MAPLASGSGPQSSQETESFLKRLAGPSTGKAGLAKDQTEINRIIAEASKGSKYYENEKRKDKELTVKIKSLLKLRDDLVRNADLAKVEQAVDKIVDQLELERDLTQVIVHVDMDAFFANVEVLHDPSLASKPFGVGHGVLTTANYEARKFGVRSGMATHVAKKLCPELIVTSISHGRYSEMSDKVFSVLRRYDPNLLVAGCDEGYMNITAHCQEHDLTPAECVQQLRQKIFDETALTASAGIAPNLMLAKISSDRHKPNGQFELKFEAQAVINFMHDLSIRKIPGIGRVSERLLDSIGVKTCGDIYTHRATLSLLDKQFHLESLLKKYLGIAGNVVTPHQREERKSIGAERTFQALSSKEKILDKMDEIAVELAQDMEQNGWAAKTITLKYKLNTYEVYTRAKSVDRWITKKEDLYNIGKELVLKEFPITIRLLGLRATKLKDLREDVPNVGIKRFFTAGEESPTPRKRTRLDDALGEEKGQLLDQSDEDAWESFPDDGIHLQVPTEGQPSLEMPVETSSESVEDAASFLTCPICSKVLKTDNDGLNTHIDFCLSKETIQAAQVEASTPQPKSRGKPKSSSKPESNKPPSKSISFWTTAKR